MRRKTRYVPALAIFLSCTLAAAPAFAEGFGRGGGSKSSSSGSKSSGSKSSSSGSKSNAPRSTATQDGGSRAQQGSGFGRAGPGRSGVRPRGAPRSTVRPIPGGGYYYDPFLLHPYDRWRMNYFYGGWGFAPWGYYGYGFTPYWGAPQPIEVYEAPPPPPRERTTSLFLGGLVTRDSGGLGGDLTIDGRHLGFNFRGTVLGLADPSTGGLDPMPFFSTHLTVAPIATPHARIRFEVGLSGVRAPDFSYYGPDVGASAQLALAGPLGLVGSVRYTPFPATIADVEGALSLQFGSVGMRAGWRSLRLDDTAVNPHGGGRASYNGPSLSIGTVF
jgi:hypothetical protein